MASDNRSRLSFVIALSIILGSAGVGWWRGQRQDVLANPDRLRTPEASLAESDAQIEAVSFGKEKPAVQGSDEAALAQNRRAEIVYR